MVVDEREGTAELTWSAYDGPSFEAYEVQRRSIEEEDFTLLESVVEVADTAYVDTDVAPDAVFFYRILLRAAGESVQSNRSGRVSYILSPVELLDVRVDSTSGQASLKWTRYDGPGFEAYEILRQAAGEAEARSLGKVAVPADTAFTDTGLAPNTDYAYQIRVYAAGISIDSNRQSRNRYEVGAVRLLAADVDSLAGTAALTWSRYGAADFRSYRVHRRILGTDSVEEVYRASSAGDTSFSDEGLLADVDYAYSVIVESETLELESDGLERRLVLPSVAIENLDFDAATATATLTWTQYEGPRFGAYLVARQSAGAGIDTVAAIADAAATTLVDSGLVGNTEYAYRVIVATDRDEHAVGAEAIGRFHRLLEAWPVETADDEVFRLFAEEDGTISVMVSGPQAIRRLTLDGDGNVVDEEEVFKPVEFSRAEHPPTRLDPSVSATAVDVGGDRLFLYGTEAGSSVAGTGSTHRFRQEVFAESITEIIGNIEPGSTSRVAISAFGQADATRIVQAAVDDALVVTDGTVFISDGFDDGPAAGWENVNANFPLGRADSGNIGRLAGRHRLTLLTAAGEGWVDFSGAADFVGSDIDLSVSVGLTVTRGFGDVSFFTLLLALEEGELTLTWREGQETSQVGLLAYPVAPYTRFRLGLSIEEGTLKAWIAGVIPDATGPWGTVTVVPARRGQDRILVTRHDRLTILEMDQPIVVNEALQHAVGDLRTWVADDRLHIALVIPDANQVRLGETPSSSIVVNEVDRIIVGSNRRVVSLGSGAGPGEGEFLFPLSMARGADDRLYVLDAGNARIQVFDLEGGYITRWGESGAGPGQFDFGHGGVASDFAGSIVVDDEGFIYVADVGNRRIQKFSP